NRDKIRRLEEEQRQLAVAAQTQADIMTEAGRRQQTAMTRATQAGKLQGFRSFAEIDWRSSVAKREELEQQKCELEQSSDKIRKLRERLGEVKGQISGFDVEKTEKAGKRGNLQGREQECVRRLAECDCALGASNQADLSIFDSALVGLLTDTEFTINNAFVLQNRSEKAVGDKLLALENERGKVVVSIVRSMGNFLGEF